MARSFTGSRDGSTSTSNVSLRIVRETLSKGGRINEDTFKKIVKAKLMEARMNMANKPAVKNSMFGSGGTVKRSEKAQKAVDMMNQARRAKELRRANKEVVILARRFTNGKIDQKGRIYDVAGNIVAKVNIKNGAISDINGQHIGIYKAKSQAVVNSIQDAINRVSPYFANQRAAILQQRKFEAESAENSGAQLDVWSRTPTDAWGRVATDIWGRPKSDIWGRTQRDMWGNQQVDAWGNQI